MQHFEISLPSGANEKAVAQAITDAIAEYGLRVTLLSTLKKHPGCIHWHVKSPPAAQGTLEITFWPQERRAWFTVQDGRRADWIVGEMRKIDEAVRKCICSNR